MIEVAAGLAAGYVVVTGRSLWWIPAIIAAACVVAYVGGVVDAYRENRP